MPNAEQICRIIEARENPFDDDKVLKARDIIYDVPEIHHSAYRKLISELERVRSKGASRSVLLTGVAGSGKSHLIARFYRDRPKDVLFFQIQALPGGTHWLKHVVQCIVNELEQPISHEDPTPQLNLLVRHFIEAAKSTLSDQGTEPSPKRLMGALKKKRLEIESVIPDPIAGDILNVLGKFWKHEAPFADKKEEFRQLAYQWLKGIMIEEDELAQIGARRNFSSAPEFGMSNYLAALRVFGMLTKGRAPIILVFDQLDTMEYETVNSLGKQLLTLIGGDAAAPNYFLLVAGVDQEINGFIDNQIITRAVGDVLFKTRLELPALNPKQCGKIVELRLRETFTEEDRKLFPSEADSLFPFTSQFVEKAVEGPVMPSARMLISTFRGAYDGIDPEWLEKWPDFDSTARNEAPWQAVSTLLEREFEKSASGFSPRLIDDDTLCEMLKRLISLRGDSFPLRIRDLPHNRLKDFCSASFGVSTKPGSSIAAITACAKGNASSFKAALTRINEYLGSNPDHGVLLIRQFTAKSMDNWIQNKEMLGRFDSDRFHLTDLKTDLPILQALENLRLGIRDMVLPATRDYDARQITGEDFLRYLDESKKMEDLSIIRKTLGMLGSEPPVEVGTKTRTDGTLTEHKSFIWARVEARKIYSVEKIKLDWANHQGRTNVTAEEEKLLEEAVRLLENEGRIVVIGVINRVLKKV